MKQLCDMCLCYKQQVLIISIKNKQNFTIFIKTIKNLDHIDPFQHINTINKYHFFKSLTNIVFDDSYTLTSQMNISECPTVNNLEPSGENLTTFTLSLCPM